MHPVCLFRVLDVQANVRGWRESKASGFWPQDVTEEVAVCAELKVTGCGIVFWR